MSANMFACRYTKNALGSPLVFHHLLDIRALQKVLSDTNNIWRELGPFFAFVSISGLAGIAARGRSRELEGPRNFARTCHAGGVSEFYSYGGCHCPCSPPFLHARRGSLQGSDSRTVPFGTRRGSPSTTMQSFWFSLRRRLCSWATSSAKKRTSCVESSWSQSSFGSLSRPTSLPARVLNIMLKVKAVSDKQQVSTSGGGISLTSTAAPCKCQRTRPLSTSTSQRHMLFRKGRGEMHISGRHNCSFSSLAHKTLKEAPCRKQAGWFLASKFQLEGSDSSSSTSATLVTFGVNAHSQSGCCWALELAMTGRRQKKFCGCSIVGNGYWWIRLNYAYLHGQRHLSNNYRLIELQEWKHLIRMGHDRTTEVNVVMFMSMYDTSCPFLFQTRSRLCAGRRFQSWNFALGSDAQHCGEAIHLKDDEQGRGGRGFFMFVGVESTVRHACLQTRFLGGCQEPSGIAFLAKNFHCVFKEALFCSIELVQVSFPHDVKQDFAS